MASNPRKIRCFVPSAYQMNLKRAFASRKFEVQVVRSSMPVSMVVEKFKIQDSLDIDDFDQAADFPEPVTQSARTDLRPIPEEAPLQRSVLPPKNSATTASEKISANQENCDQSNSNKVALSPSRLASTATPKPISSRPQGSKLTSILQKLSDRQGSALHKVKNEQAPSTAENSGLSAKNNATMAFASEPARRANKRKVVGPDRPWFLDTQSGNMQASAEKYQSNVKRPKTVKDMPFQLLSGSGPRKTGDHFQRSQGLAGDFSLLNSQKIVADPEGILPLTSGMFRSPVGGSKQRGLDANRAFTPLVSSAQRRGPVGSANPHRDPTYHCDLTYTLTPPKRHSYLAAHPVPVPVFSPPERVKSRHEKALPEVTKANQPSRKFTIEYIPTTAITGASFSSRPSPQKLLFTSRHSDISSPGITFSKSAPLDSQKTEKSSMPGEELPLDLRHPSKRPSADYTVTDDGVLDFSRKTRDSFSAQQPTKKSSQAPASACGPLALTKPKAAHGRPSGSDARLQARPAAQLTTISPSNRQTFPPSERKTPGGYRGPSTPNMPLKFHDVKFHKGRQIDGAGTAGRPLSVARPSKNHRHKSHTINPTFPESRNSPSSFHAMRSLAPRFKTEKTTYLPNSERTHRQAPHPFRSQHRNLLPGRRNPPTPSGRLLPSNAPDTIPVPVSFDPSTSRYPALPFDRAPPFPIRGGAFPLKQVPGPHSTLSGGQAHPVTRYPLDSRYSHRNSGTRRNVSKKQASSERKESGVGVATSVDLDKDVMARCILKAQNELRMRTAALGKAKDRPKTHSPFLMGRQRRHQAAENGKTSNPLMLGPADVSARHTSPLSGVYQHSSLIPAAPDATRNEKADDDLLKPFISTDGKESPGSRGQTSNRDRLTMTPGFDTNGEDSSRDEDEGDQPQNSSALAKETLCKDVKPTTSVIQACARVQDAKEVQETSTIAARNNAEAATSSASFSSADKTESESKTPSVNSDATEPPESKPVAQDASHLLIKSSPINPAEDKKQVSAEDDLGPASILQQLPLQKPSADPPPANALPEQPDPQLQNETPEGASLDSQMIREALQQPLTPTSAEMPPAVATDNREKSPHPASPPVKQPVAETFNTEKAETSIDCRYSANVTSPVAGESMPAQKSSQMSPEKLHGKHSSPKHEDLVENARDQIKMKVSPVRDAPAETPVEMSVVSSIIGNNLPKGLLEKILESSSFAKPLSSTKEEAKEAFSSDALLVSAVSPKHEITSASDIKSIEQVPDKLEATPAREAKRVGDNELQISRHEILAQTNELEMPVKLSTDEMGETFPQQPEETPNFTKSEKDEVELEVADCQPREKSVIAATLKSPKLHKTSVNDQSEGIFVLNEEKSLTKPFSVTNIPHADGVDIKETNLSTDTDVAPMGLKETVLCKSSDRHDDDAVKHRDETVAEADMDLTGHGAEQCAEEDADASRKVVQKLKLRMVKSQEKGGTVGPQWTLVENGQRSVAHVTEQTTSQVDVTNPSCAAATFGSALVLSENEEPKNETLPPPVQPKVDESNEVDESDLVPNVDEGTAKVGVATADQQLLAKNTQVDETEVRETNAEAEKKITNDAVPTVAKPPSPKSPNRQETAKPACTKPPNPERRLSSVESPFFPFADTFLVLLDREAAHIAMSALQSEQQLMRKLRHEKNNLLKLQLEAGNVASPKPEATVGADKRRPAATGENDAPAKAIKQPGEEPPRVINQEQLSSRCTTPVARSVEPLVSSTESQFAKRSVDQHGIENLVDATPQAINDSGSKKQKRARHPTDTAPASDASNASPSTRPAPAKKPKLSAGKSKGKAETLGSSKPDVTSSAAADDIPRMRTRSAMTEISSAGAEPASSSHLKPKHSSKSAVQEPREAAPAAPPCGGGNAVPKSGSAKSLRGKHGVCKVLPPVSVPAKQPTPTQSVATKRRSIRKYCKDVSKQK